MRKHFTVIFLLILLTVFSNCGNKQKQSTQKWSIKMADAVMDRYEKLAFYNGRTRAGWSYDIALLGSAIDKLGVINAKYPAYMQEFMDMLVDTTGQIERYNMESYNIDLIRPATNLLTLAQRTGDKKYELAIPQFIKQMENHPKTITGGYWHKKRYTSQMWLDGIFMGSPFLAQYAKIYNQPKWFDEVTHQITLVYEKTVDPKTELLYHAWDESKEQKWSNPGTGQSPHFWSRAMGWYMMAIVDVLDYLPEDHPKRNEIVQILKKTAEALKKVRDEQSGVWYQVLDMGGIEGNYLEGSGSAMFVYAFAKGAKNGYLDTSYYDLANSAFDGMLKTFIVTDNDGLPSMKNICGSCGLGGNPYRDGSYEYYINERIVTNDSKGIAPFIMAAIELDR